MELVSIPDLEGDRVYVSINMLNEAARELYRSPSVAVLSENERQGFAFLKETVGKATKVTLSSIGIYA